MLLCDVVYCSVVKYMKQFPDYDLKIVGHSMVSQFSSTECLETYLAALKSSCTQEAYALFHSSEGGGALLALHLNTVMYHAF
jgi:hypothetical protein